VRLPSVLQRDDFRKLFFGQGVSSLGDWMGTIAFMVVTNDITGSPVAVGGILVLRLLPGIVAAPLAGRAAYRLGYRKTMLAMDALRAAIVFVVPLHFALWWIYLWAFMLEVGSLLFLPARDSAIPELVSESQIPVANSFILGSSYGTIPLGAGLFAAFLALPTLHFGLVAGRQYTFVFWADAATFLISFEMIRRIAALRDKKPTWDAGDAHSAAFHDAFRIPLVRSIIPSTTAIVLGLGALFSLGIVFVEDVLGASQAEFGVLIALFGVGAMAGLGLVQLRHHTFLSDMRVGVGLAGTMIVVTSLAPSVLIAYVGAAGFGTGVSYALTSGMSFLQEQLRGEERVLAFTAFHIVIRVGLGLGAIGAGAAGDFLGRVDWPFVGSLAPSRMVLLCAGLLVVLSVGAVRAPAERPGLREREGAAR
jgi:MFS family permease